MKKQKTKTKESWSIDFAALWQAKAKAWKCRPVYIWDDCLCVYPKGLAVTRNGQVFLIDRKGARKMSLAESLRFYRKYNPTQDGGTYGEAFHHWFKLIEQALERGAR